MTVDEVLHRLKNIKRYDYRIHECSCCDAYVEFDESKDGDYIRNEDIQKLITEIEASQ